METSFLTEELLNVLYEARCLLRRSMERRASNFRLQIKFPNTQNTLLFSRNAFIISSMDSRAIKSLLWIQELLKFLYISMNTVYTSSTIKSFQWVFRLIQTDELLKVFNRPMSFWISSAYPWVFTRTEELFMDFYRSNS